MPSSAFPGSNQRLIVGLKPPGKASRPKMLLNRSSRAAFALPARNTFGILRRLKAAPKIFKSAGKY